MAKNMSRSLLGIDSKVCPESSPIVIVCTDLSRKEPDNWGVDRVVTSRSLGGIMVNTQARNGKMCGFDLSGKEPRRQVECG